MNYDEETWQNIIQQLSSDHQVNTIVKNYDYLLNFVTIWKTLKEILKFKILQHCVGDSSEK